jgi:hypothetical protein
MLSFVHGAGTRQASRAGTVPTQGGERQRLPGRDVTGNAATPFRVLPAEAQLVPDRAADPRRLYAPCSLGLFVVQQIVEAHGGAVHVQQAQNGGACFVIEIPRDEAAAEGGIG